MPQYTRIRIPGATYFFTLALADRRSGLLVDQVDILRRAFHASFLTMPVTCEAIVVLPDHLHAVWTLPEGDNNYPERWRKIKARFSRAVRLEVGKIAHPTSLTPSKRRKREAGIWQRRYWEHCIRNEADFRAHVQYCWGNPVKHGLVERAVDWPYSSIHRDIRLGKVDAEWAGGFVDGDFGE